MTTCPTCGRDTTRATCNGADSVQITVPRAALPALEHALAVGRNTQMMCRGPEAKDMMEALRLEVRAAAPACAFLFRDPDWAAFGARLAAGEKMVATLVNAGRYSWDRELRIMLHREGDDPETGYRSKEEFTDRAEAEAVLAAITDEANRLTPMPS